MTYAIAWEHQGATIRYTESVSFGEFMEAVLKIHANPNYAALKYVIHDMLGASHLDFDSVDMTAMVAHELGARYTNPGVRPVVVSDNPLMQEKTRIFSDITRLEVGFCHSLAAARAWVQAEVAASAATAQPL
ncbi:MAG: hypothetical protein HXX19_09855 [Rhodoferax sp.]|nr:hypothetical protein [Rhodoferax sp.]